MKLFNPIANLVYIVVEGVRYEVGPESVVEVPEEVGVRWLKTHDFLQIHKEEKPAKEPKKETK